MHVLPLVYFCTHGMVGSTHTRARTLFLCTTVVPTVALYAFVIGVVTWTLTKIIGGAQKGRSVDSPRAQTPSTPCLPLANIGSSPSSDDRKDFSGSVGSACSLRISQDRYTKRIVVILVQLAITQVLRGELAHVYPYCVYFKAEMPRGGSRPPALPVVGMGEKRAPVQARSRCSRGSADW